VSVQDELVEKVYEGVDVLGKEIIPSHQFISQSFVQFSLSPPTKSTRVPPVELLSTLYPSYLPPTSPVQ
jgi:hypothetical protein